MTDRAIDFFREERSRPWLFSFNCFDPHPPLDPPQDYLDRFDSNTLPAPELTDESLRDEEALTAAGVNFQTTARRIPLETLRLDLARYWAMIELIDDNVGRMLDALEESGQRENTVVIFSSDHGHMIGDHGLVNKGCRFYEGLVRVPLIMSWPARFRTGLQSNALVELVDIAPTLLGLAGLPVPDGMHGRSLLPILTSESPPATHRDFVRCTYTETLQGPRSSGTMVRDRRYKLVNYHGTGLGQLFDLESDPGELHNLWNDAGHAALRNELLLTSFDAEVLHVDAGSPRVGRY